MDGWMDLRRKKDGKVKNAPQNRLDLISHILLHQHIHSISNPLVDEVGHSIGISLISQHASPLLYRTKKTALAMRIYIHTATL